MNFIDAIKSGFKNCFKYSGRASRSEYWYFYLFTLLVNFPLQLLEKIDHEFVLVLSLIGSIIILVPTIALQVRRYHDVGLSGKWFLLIIAIGVGIWIGALWLVEAHNAEFDFYTLAGVVSIFCFIINFGISCKCPTAEDNKYGSNPLLVSGETSEEINKEIRTQTVDDKKPEKPIEVANIENDSASATNEPSKPEAKTATEIELAKIEDMYERSVINKTERNKLRKKALGLD